MILIDRNKNGVQKIKNELVKQHFIGGKVKKCRKVCKM